MNTNPGEKVHCSNCGAWEYRLAVDLGQGSGYWLRLSGSPTAIGFGPGKHFCSMRCVAEYSRQESEVLW
jgi:hypothetical protein